MGRQSNVETEDVAMPLFFADFEKETQGFSLEHTGAYMLLLMECFINDTLPSDIHLLCAIARCPEPRWKNVIWPKLRPFFEQISSGQFISPTVNRWIKWAYMDYSLGSLPSPERDEK